MRFGARTHAQSPSTCSELTVDSTSVALNVLLSPIEQRFSPMAESVPPVSDTPAATTSGEIVPASSIPLTSIREAVREAVAEIFPTAFNPPRDAPSSGKHHLTTVVAMTYIHPVSSVPGAKFLFARAHEGSPPSLFSPRWATSGPSLDDKGIRAQPTILSGSRDPGRSPCTGGLPTW